MCVEVQDAKGLCGNWVPGHLSCRLELAGIPWSLALENVLQDTEPREYPRKGHPGVPRLKKDILVQGECSEWI